MSARAVVLSKGFTRVERFASEIAHMASKLGPGQAGCPAVVRKLQFFPMWTF